MANYSELLNDINAAIYENNDQEIDALEVRAILREMVTSLGSGFLFKGIATPSSPSGTGTYEPDQNVFYLATTAGTYTYLGGLVVAAGEVAFLCFDGTWTKKSSALLSTGSIVDNLTTADATKPLSAKQGKVLAEAGAATAAEVTALGHKVDGLALGKFYGFFPAAADLPAGDDAGYAYVGESAPFAIYVFNGSSWSDSGSVYSYPVGNGEDIDTNASGQLQFANRPDTNGMGYKILRTDATFASQVTDSDTIYEIRYDFDLAGGSVTIPSGCVLRFNGGSISNGSLSLSSQVGISGAGRFLSGDIIVDSTNNIYVLNLVDDCSLQMSGTTPGHIYVYSNKTALITMTGTNSLIPYFEKCNIYKDSYLGFVSYYNTPQVSVLKDCIVTSPTFDTREEGKCTTSFSVHADTLQDSYDLITNGYHNVFIENCVFHGQGLWGSLQIKNTRFEITTNNMYNYEVLHLVGNSVVDGCFFQSLVVSYVSGMEDVIDCYVSKHIDIRDCIFKGCVSTCISYKQNYTDPDYVIPGRGLNITGCVFEDCAAMILRINTDQSVTDFTNNEASFISFERNSIVNCNSPINPSSISDLYGMMQISGGCSFISIKRNRIKMNVRNMFLRIMSYSHDIEIAENEFITDGLSGTCFLLSLYQTSNTFSNIRNLSIRDNILNGFVLGRDQTSWVNLKNAVVTGNVAAGALFNSGADSGLFASRDDVFFDGNKTLTSAGVLIPDKVYNGQFAFNQIRMKFIGSSYFSITDGNKQVVWNGSAWVNMDGTAL